jgi:hypothetical protein
MDDTAILLNNLKIIKKNIRSKTLIEPEILKKMWREQKLLRSPLIKQPDIHKSIKNFDKSSQSDLYFHIPDQIKITIDDNIQYIFNHRCVIYGCQLIIDYYLKENDCLNLDKYELMTKDFVFLCTYLLGYANSKPKTIHLHMYLTDRKKLYVNENYLDRNNCNTALTYSCQINVEIVIFRQEELFKVVIHELFHALCLDFSSFDCNYMKLKIDEMFPIKQLNNPYEAYAEFWANIINCVFYSFKHSTNLGSFIKVFNKCINNEIIFSVFQLTKMLKNMGLSYNQILNVNNTYNEYTNVFSYYILKTILLFNVGDFLNWCREHNLNSFEFRKTPEKIIKMTEFIEKKYKGKKLLNMIEKINKLYFDNEFFNKTLRMTVHDFFEF